MSFRAHTRLSRSTSCLPISQGGNHASKSTSVPAKAGCGRNGAKRHTKTTVCLSRLFSGLCWGSTGAGMEVTKCLKPPDSSHEFGDCASVQAATRVNAEQTSHDEGLVKGSHYGHIDSLAGSCCGSQTKVCESREAVCNQPWVKGMMQMVTIDPWSASDRIGFPAY